MATNIRNVLVNMNTILHTSHCAVCLSQHELEHWDKEYIFISERNEISYTLFNIITTTFGSHITSLLSTEYLCKTCSSTILKSYLFVRKIRNNYEMINKNVSILNAGVHHTLENLHEDQLQCFIHINENVHKKDYSLRDNVTDVPKITIFSIETREDASSQFKMDLDTDYFRNKDKYIVPDKLENDITESTIWCNENRKETQYQVSDTETSFDEARYECPYCGLKTNNLLSYKMHYVRCHVKETCFECSQCFKMFSTLSVLTKHRHYIHCEKVSYCDECKVILCNHTNAEHLTEHKKSKACICDSCQQTFPNESTLLDHVALAHNSDLECQFCLKIFTREYHLIHHRCLFKCSECTNECVHSRYLAFFREQYNEKDQSLYKCLDCEFTYDKRNQLIQHVNEEHLKFFPYLCDVCGDKFASKPLLRIHVDKMHSSDKTNSIKIVEGTVAAKYMCDICAAQFDTENECASHKTIHNQEKIQCQFCGKVVCSIATYNKHLKTKHVSEVDGPNAVYQCTMCTSDFNYKEEYLLHTASHSEGSEHICRICGKAFAIKYGYYSHLRKHQINYNMKCLICCKKYTKQTISRHMRQHIENNDVDRTNVVKYEPAKVCSECGVFFESSKSLMKHIQTHSEEKQCPECLKGINIVLYDTHLKTHKKEEPKLFSCSECKYKTKFSFCLEGHINRHHAKVKPYQCDICTKMFYSAAAMRTHKATHSHPKLVLYCEICGNKFKSKKALLLHTRIHTGERPYPCDMCESSFLSASRRKQHVIRKHNSPAVECAICAKKMYTQSDLRRHIGDCHGGKSVRKLKKR